jgi:hypothetical protein
VEVADLVQSGEREFNPALREFLDFYYSAGAEEQMLATRFEPVLLTNLQDLYLAATAEHLCLANKHPIPEWTSKHGVPLRKPHFAGKLETLKATLLQESPLAFRKRMLFVSENALERASRHAQKSLQIDIASRLGQARALGR